MKGSSRHATSALGARDFGVQTGKSTWLPCRCHASSCRYPQKLCLVCDIGYDTVYRIATGMCYGVWKTRFSPNTRLASLVPLLVSMDRDNEQNRDVVISLPVRYVPL